MHSVLARQLKKLYGSSENLPKEVARLAEVVSKTYQDADSDRALLERSMEINSHELQTQNKELNKLNKLMIGREIKMVELKEKIRKLEKNWKVNNKLPRRGGLLFFKTFIFFISLYTL